MFILQNKAEGELSNQNRHISLALLVTELWTSKIDEHLTKTLLKIQAISTCSY